MPESPLPARCPECGTEVAPALTSCPACHRLVHAEALKLLASEAEEAERSGDDAKALSAWRRALGLLPAGSRQHIAIASRAAGLAQRLEAAGHTTEAIPPRPSWARRAGPIGIVALAAWKLFAKAGALLSMILSFGVYWAAWGWRFALGLVVSIYVHELGHVAALHRLGVPASAPMFVPGIGAFVKHRPLANRHDEARVALAGPLWGLGASLLACAAWLATGIPVWAAIAQWGARLNLLNLTPMPPFDGGTAFRALSRDQRWVVVFTSGAVLYHTHEGLLWLVLLLAVARALGTDAPAEPEWTSLATFVFLLAALAGLGTLQVPSATEP